MAFQTVFRRYEIKYLIDRDEKEIILEAMKDQMKEDRYGKSLIRNLYLDTDDYRLIRRSLEKPVYKEKIRIRGYGEANGGETVFVELKKKYDSVVYKRRLALPRESALAWVSGEAAFPKTGQISREIDYFLSFYQTLSPKVYLSYEREAYAMRDKSPFRVTFDENVLARCTDPDLSHPGGESLLPEGKILMELKCIGGIPLWMVRVLSRENIRKTSFSKYGTAYQKMIFPQKCENN